MQNLRPIRDPRLDTTLGGVYRLDQVLGRGSMGSVYQAVDLRDGSQVAVKVLRAIVPDADASATEHSADEERTARRFAREARIITTLNHPHIVKVLHFSPGSGSEEAFFVMELLKGEHLGEVLKRRRLTEAEALCLYTPLLGAIGYAHRMGVVHRDIKPDNVFLVHGALSDPRVLDFGIGKVVRPDASQLTDDAMLGTPAYMSPELMRSPASADGRADIFALGAMLFHALSGALPFDGESMLAVLHKILEGDPKPLRAYRPDIHPEVEQVVMRAMARRPEDRYEDAGAMLTALRRAVMGSGEKGVGLGISESQQMAVADTLMGGEGKTPAPGTALLPAVPETTVLPVVPTGTAEAATPTGLTMPVCRITSELPALRPAWRLRTELFPPGWLWAAVAGCVLGVILGVWELVTLR